jgi:ribosomal protein S18 acetylase RimI-like enzyme
MIKDYIISTDKQLLDIQKIWLLLKDCFWSKNIPIEYIARFVQHSLCFGVYSLDKQQVGFGRVITDYTTYAYVCDVIIESNHRRKGLASALIQTMLNHPDLQGLKTWSLVSTGEAKKIYKDNGFLPVSNACEALEITNLQIYSEPEFVNLHDKLDVC